MASDANNIEYPAVRALERLRAHSEALRGGNLRVGSDGVIEFPGLIPGGHRGGRAFVRYPVQAGQCSYDLQQRPRAATLLIKGVGGNAGRYLLAGKRSTHGNHLD